MTRKTYAIVIGSSAAAGILSGFLAGRWYGAAVGGILSILVAEVLFRQIGNRALEAFFDSPGSAKLPDLGLRGLPGGAALIGFAMTFDPPSGESVMNEPDTPRAASGIGLSERIIALETVVRSRTLDKDKPLKESDPRAVRKAEEFAMKRASSGSSEIFLRRYVQVAHAPGDAYPLIKLALSLLILSASRNDAGAVERLESYFERNALPREIVRLAIGEGLCGRTSAWDVLGLPPGASKEDIKKAYRSLSLARHPDAGGKLDARSLKEREEAFRAAKDAYDLLNAITP